MAQIKKIQARQILDSRGNPTVEVEVWTALGNCGRAAVPSGASTGSREALELRDQNAKIYKGKSVLQAISHIEEILTPALLDKEVSEQEIIDRRMLELDGTDFKTKLGANALLGVSLACARAASLDQKKSLYEYLFSNLKCPNKLKKKILPMPLMNFINGGAHASNNLDIQEFMVVPHMDKNFSENLRASVEVFHTLKDILKKKNYATNVGDEGGFAPNLKSHEEGMELLLSAIEQAGYRPGEDLSLSLDVAASEFFQEGHYHMQGKKYSSADMVSYYKDFVKKYPIYSIEDGLAEADHKGWKLLTQELTSQIMLVGDDLFVTNKKIFAEGIKNEEANAILIKLNQIGTLTETFDTLRLAFESDYEAIISHRSGETADTFIADLAVASGCGHIKTGSASRADRTEKYNQLLRIEEALGKEALYYKKGARRV